MMAGRTKQRRRPIDDDDVFCSGAYTSRARALSPLSRATGPVICEKGGERIGRAVLWVGGVDVQLEGGGRVLIFGGQGRAATRAAGSPPPKSVPPATPTRPLLELMAGAKKVVT